MNQKIDYDPNMNKELIYKLLPVINGLRNYHDHQVVGLENFPNEGRVLLVVNHSLATYDIAMLFAAIFERSGRIVRPMADHLFFRIPFLGELVTALGAVDGCYKNATALLKKGHAIGVAPGGMREALRPSTERYQIRWEKRAGFAKVALDTGTPIVIAVCPKADDLYDVYPNKITSWAYRKFRVPIFLARGVGFSPIPRPAKLVHFLSEPMMPPKPKDDPLAYQRQLRRFHRSIIKRTEELIGAAIAFKGN